MNLIAAVDRNWAIGKNGRILVSIPEDMKFFREETMGKVVVMGRKTLESLPGSMPVAGRTNIVLTRNRSYRVNDAIVCHSIEEVLREVKKYHSEDVYVIGGESIYRQLLDYCDVAHITKVDYAYDADTYFPDLDRIGNWKVADLSDEKTYFDIVYEFVKYVKTAD